MLQHSMRYYKNSTDTVSMLLLLLFSLSFTLQFQAEAVALPGLSCPKSCGDVEIVFPFGIGDDCAREGFKLYCNETDDGRSKVAFLYEYDLPVLNIALLHGQVQIKNYISSMCYIQNWGFSQSISSLNLSTTPFTFSEKLNKFMVLGINTLAYMVDSTYVLGCVSQCSPYNNLTAQDGLCTGAGCCQFEFTSNMSYYEVYFNEQYNATDYFDRSTSDNTMLCGYAMMMESAAFRFNKTYLNNTVFYEEHGGLVPMILDWAVGNENCDVARKNADLYACRSDNSTCVDSNNGKGYLCNCTEGYQGNPYLPNGCQDIDECGSVPPPCAGCINTPGNFSCPNEKSPKSFNDVALILGLSIGVVILVIAITCTYVTHERKKLANIKQKYFQQHGGMLLLQEISLKQGAALSIFTESDLMEATDKFDNENILGRGVAMAPSIRAPSRTAV